ncbi:hypothetical protein D3C87_1193790 [compost metagenome]
MSCHSNCHASQGPQWLRKPSMPDNPTVEDLPKEELTAVVEVPEGPVVIQTVAPIPVTDLKRKFTEEVEFHISIDNSRLKDAALITYLSNLNIACRLKFGDAAMMQNLLVAYLKSTVLVSIGDLEELAINVILAATGKPFRLPFDPQPFIEANYELVDLWLRRLDSLPLYALQCKAELKEDVLNYPQDEDETLVGLNFVKLIAHENFPLVCLGIEESDYNWNKLFFNEYCFAGSNLFAFYAHKNNPYFMALIGQEAPEQFAVLTENLRQKVKEIEHVPSA